MKSQQGLAIFAALIMVVVGFSSCDSDKAADQIAKAAYSYAGPGSNWEIDIDTSAGTFGLVEKDSASEASGTYTSLSTGFLKMTVDKATGSAAPAVGAEFIGINIPDFMFAMKPFTGSQMITMVTSGACRANGGFNLNWVAMRQQDPALTGLVYGTVAWDIASSAVRIDSAFQANATVDNGAPYSLSAIQDQDCTEGVAEPASGDERMYITHSGGMIITTNATDASQAHFVWGLEVEEVQASQLNGNWYGFVYDASDATAIRPVSAVISGGTSLTLTAIDPETGNASGSVADGDLTLLDLGFTESSKKHHGMFRYDFTSDGADGGCAIDATIQENAEKRIIACSGLAANGTDNFNLVLVYKP